MDLGQCRFLADENIHPLVVGTLCAEGIDVEAVADSALAGRPDSVVLEHAVSVGRVVLTHDSDFGSLALASKKPYVGILYLRPGHINPQITLDTLRVLFSGRLVVEPPFIVVARRREDNIHVRIR